MLDDDFEPSQEVLYIGYDFEQPEEPWVEKYRPTEFEEVVGIEKLIHHFRNYVLSKNLPLGIIAAGPPGCGKTTLMKILVSKLFPHEDLENLNVIELNASDDRNLSSIRTLLQKFPILGSSLAPGIYKIVWLEECDNMTKEAQECIYHYMPLCSETTRFIFTCNQLENMIQPLQSLCQKLRFTGLTMTQMCKRLEQILKAEGEQFTTQDLESIALLSNGDMRQAISNAQMACVYRSIHQTPLSESLLIIGDVSYLPLVKRLFLEVERFRSMVKDSKALLQQQSTKSKKLVPSNATKRNSNLYRNFETLFPKPIIGKEHIRNGLKMVGKNAEPSMEMSFYQSFENYYKNGYSIFDIWRIMVKVLEVLPTHQTNLSNPNPIKPKIGCISEETRNYCLKIIGEFQRRQIYSWIQFASCLAKLFSIA